MDPKAKAGMKAKAKAMTKGGLADVVATACELKRKQEVGVLDSRTTEEGWCLQRARPLPHEDPYEAGDQGGQARR